MSAVNIKATSPLLKKHENIATLDDYVYIQNNLNVAKHFLQNAYNRSCEVYGSKTTEHCKVQDLLNDSRSTISKYQNKMQKRFGLTEDEAREYSDPKVQISVTENVPEYISISVKPNF